MRRVEETWAAIDTLCAPLPPERAAGLRDACGRVLARDLVAPGDLPPFARSAMDGYLVRAGSGPGAYTLLGELRPGAPLPEPLPGPGEALRVFTGTTLPDAGWHVVRQEDTDHPGDADRSHIRLHAAAGPDHLRPRGSHARAGTSLLPAGTRLGPGALALLASMGHCHPWVAPRIPVAYFATGSELVAPEALHPHDLRTADANTPLMQALLEAQGAELRTCARLDESTDALARGIENALARGCRTILVGGGSSLGDHDHTADAFAACGFDLRIRGVRSRPGKPLIVATRGPVLAFGLPGNPLSHFVCHHLFVARALDRLAGLQPRERIAVHCDLPLPEDPARDTWWPARLALQDGRLHATPLPWTDSSDLRSLAFVDALLHLPAADPGAPVPARLPPGMRLALPLHPAFPHALSTAPHA